MAEAAHSVPNTTGTSGASTTSGTGTGTSGSSSNSVPATFSSLEELRTKYPEFYQKFLQGLAMNMVSDMKKQQDRLKQMMREARRNAGIN